MRGFIRSWALSGGPLYAECGGFLYLLDEIIAEGERFPMAGVFPFRAELRERRAALGYVEVEAARDTILLEKGGTMRGHVFHYTEIGRVESLPEGMEAAYRVTRTDGRVEECEGFTVGSTLASYVHLYFPSRPEAARRFVERCRSWKKHGK